MRNKITLIILIFAAATCIALEKKQNNTTTNSALSVDPTIVTSMASLRTVNDKPLLPWSADDGIVSLAELYEEELKKQENKLWSQAQSVFGLNRKTFNQKVAADRYKFTNKKAKRSEQLSSEVIAFVEDILQKCGFDPKTIAILANTTAGTSPAGTISKAIYIYEPAFKKLDRRAFTYIVAHEAMHIRHQDSIERMTLKKMLMVNGQLTEQQETFLNNYSRFQETRADLHAILIDPLFAQGGIVYYNHLLTNSNTDTTVHPKSKDRLRLCMAVDEAWCLIPKTVIG